MSGTPITLTGDAVDRLAAYEDTGLEPEEVNRCKLTLMGKSLAEITEFDGVAINRLKELATADKQGRLVVMPCKVGDTVWVDVRTLPYHYLHPADGCGDFARCEIVSIVNTGQGTYLKLRALYPSRAGRRDYLRRMSMNCKYCKADCVHRGEDREKECRGHIHMTNADRIRAMSDEELAHELRTHGFALAACSEKAWLEWLQQPAEEVDHE